MFALFSFFRLVDELCLWIFLLIPRPCRLQTCQGLHYPSPQSLALSSSCCHRLFDAIRCSGFSCAHTVIIHTGLHLVLHQKMKAVMQPWWRESEKRKTGTADRRRRTDIADFAHKSARNKHFNVFNETSPKEWSIKKKKKTKKKTEKMKKKTRRTQEEERKEARNKGKIARIQSLKTTRVRSSQPPPTRKK